MQVAEQGRHSLVQFLVGAFDDRELRGLARDIDPDISAALPTGGAIRSVAEDMLSVAQRRGALDTRFFELLVDRRPRLRPEIYRLAALTGLDLGPALTSSAGLGRFWSGFNRRETTIFVGRKPRATPHTSESIGYADGLALALVIAELGRGGQGMPVVEASRALSPRDEDEAIVIIGGPRVHAPFARLWKDLPVVLDGLDGEQRQMVPRDGPPLPSCFKESEQRYLTDTGLIALIPGYFRTGRPVLVLAGRLGWGTWGASRVVTDNSDFAAMLGDVQEGGLAAVVEFDVQGPAPSARRLLRRWRHRPGAEEGSRWESVR